MPADEEAKQMVKSGQATCVIIQNGKIISTAAGPGIAPLLSIYESKPEILKGAFVVDKVIGKAAAMMIILGGAKGAYGELMSDSALAYLTGRGCTADYGRRTDFILNRSGTGMCPLENSVLDTDDPETGYRVLKRTIEKFKAQQAPGKPAE